MTSGPIQNSPLLEELQQKLNEEALAVTEKMDAARQVISDDNYPSDQLLNAVANLLAINLDKSSRD